MFPNLPKCGPPGGIEPPGGWFIGGLVTNLLGRLLANAALPASITFEHSASALGVFFGFEVFNFYFFFLSHNCLSLSFVCGLVDVSRTEEQLTAARDVSFWDQVIELDQLFLIS
ncbi:MAG: hypothetical protein H0W66_08865 [Chthoniobacterales bacterium]|nr:hypothetical protein [Chthoniobacterales bacterium]